MKHTPGPWEAVGTVVRTMRWADGGGFMVADCPAGTAERRANAQLIAAAPQLLAVCKEMLESKDNWSDYDVSPSIIDRLRVAIYLAEAGE
jgi:hypothetical protein